MNLRHRGTALTGAALILLAAALPAGAYSIWDLQAVDAFGRSTDPVVNGDPTDPANRVWIEGIVLNNPNDFTQVAGSGFQYWQIYVQSQEAGKPAGIAVWQGSPWMSTWPPSYPDVNPGDLVRVTGFLQETRGKSNINSRHSGAPQMDFTVEVLGHPGMVAPIVIPSLADCDYFSPLRLDQPGDRGGEFYQAQWCELSDVWITTQPTDPPPWGTGWGWGANMALMVTDSSGATFPLYLSAAGDFDWYAPPDGHFNVVGIFDQEDITGYTGGYRLWVLHDSDFGAAQGVPEPATLSLLLLGACGLAARRRRAR